jgi:hypothetical protein
MHSLKLHTDAKTLCQGWTVPSETLLYDDKRPASPRMQLLHVIMSIEAWCHGSGNATSSQARQMMVHALDELDRRGTVTASQTPSSIHGLRRLSAQRVRNCLREHGKRSRRPYFGAVLKRQHRRARVRWYSTVRIWDLVKSLVLQLIQVHSWTTRWQSSRLKKP